jgi:iron complex transport system substrate-binding protein
MQSSIVFTNRIFFLRVLVPSWLVVAATLSAASGGVPPATDGFPVTIQNCGVSTTYAEPPKRAVAMNQSATEIMLALGLEKRLVGTAYLDDAVLPGLAAAYVTIPVLAAKYPSREVLLSARPDFVYAAYTSAFDDEAAGARDRLARVGARSYLSPSACGGGRRRAAVSMATFYDELRDIARIFGVAERAEALVAASQREIAAMQAAIGAVTPPPRVFWYDSGDPPSAGACCGAPAEIMRLVGAENVFKDAPGSWATVSWEAVVASHPDALVLVDASWSPAVEKRKLLSATRAYAGMEAVKRQRFVTIDFSATTYGIRLAAAARTLAASLYPEKFK